MADLTASLALKVTADTTEVVRGFTQAEQAGAKVGDTVEKKLAGGLTKAANEAKKLGDEVKKTASYAELLQKGLASYNQAAAAFGTASRIAQGAVELAKFSTEMRRLEAAIPVERMRKLEEETKGTVSKMDLLQRAAKEMGLSATEGMDEQALALKRGLAEWSDFIDQAKASIGGLISTAIVGVVDLSHAIANAISDSDERAARAIAGRVAAQKSLDASMAAFDESAAKSKVFTDQMDVLQQQSAAERLGIGKVFPGGVDAFVKGYKPPKKQAARRGSSETKRYDIGGAGMDALGGFGGGPGDGELNDVRSYGLGAEGWGAPTSLSFADRAKNALGGVGGAANDNLKKQQEELSRMTDVVKGTFDVFGSAIGAAAAAAITGSENAIAAGRKALKAKLQIIAAESVVMAAFEGAMALGSLAIGNGPAAAAHGASAAKFAVTAALAGVGSAAVGGGGSSSGQGSASSAPGGGFTPSASAAGASVREQTIHVHLHGVLAGNERDLSRQVRRGIAYGETAGLSQPGNDNITGRVE